MNEVLYSSAVGDLENIVECLENRGWKQLEMEQCSELPTPEEEYAAGVMAKIRRDDKGDDHSERNEHNIYQGEARIRDFTPVSKALKDPETGVKCLFSIAKGKYGERETVHFTGEESDVALSVEKIKNTEAFSRDDAGTDLETLLDYRSEIEIYQSCPRKDE